MARDQQQSGEQKDGRLSDADIARMRNALDGDRADASDATKGGGSNKGEAPKTGAMRDIGNALDGRD